MYPLVKLVTDKGLVIGGYDVLPLVVTKDCLESF